jgi:PEGA domain-containing protein
MWLLAATAVVGSTFIAWAPVTVADMPLLPPSPLTIPVTTIPTAVKARLLASFGPVAPEAKKAAAIAAASDRQHESTGFYGSLVIDSMPIKARAFVNDEPVGITPLVLTDVPVGSPAIRLEAENHASWSSNVRVTADRRIRINVTLAPTQ